MLASKWAWLDLVSVIWLNAMFVIPTLAVGPSILDTASDCLVLTELCVMSDLHLLNSFPNLGSEAVSFFLIWKKYQSSWYRLLNIAEQERKSDVQVNQRRIPTRVKSMHSFQDLFKVLHVYETPCFLPKVLSHGPIWQHKQTKHSSRVGNIFRSINETASLTSTPFCLMFLFGLQFQNLNRLRPCACPHVQDTLSTSINRWRWKITKSCTLLCPVTLKKILWCNSQDIGCQALGQQMFCFGLPE